MRHPCTTSSSAAGAPCANTPHKIGLIQSRPPNILSPSCATRKHNLCAPKAQPRSAEGESRCNPGALVGFSVVEGHKGSHPFAHPPPEPTLTLPHSSALAVTPNGLLLLTSILNTELWYWGALAGVGGWGGPPRRCCILSPLWGPHHSQALPAHAPPAILSLAKFLQKRPQPNTHDHLPMRQACTRISCAGCLWGLETFPQGNTSE